MESVENKMYQVNTRHAKLGLNDTGKYHQVYMLSVEILVVNLSYLTQYYNILFHSNICHV